MKFCYFFSSILDGYLYDEDGTMTVESWHPKLEYFLCKVYAELRYLRTKAFYFPASAAACFANSSATFGNFFEHKN